MKQKGKKVERQLNLFGPPEEPSNEELPQVMEEKEKAETRLTELTPFLFPKEDLRPAKPKLRRLLGKTGKYEAFYALGDREFVAKATPKSSDPSILDLCICELVGEEEVEAVKGGIFELTGQERNIYRLKARSSKNVDRADMSFYLTEKYHQDLKGHGLATEMAKLLLEKAKDRGIKVMYAHVLTDEKTGEFDKDGEASSQILSKLGFRYLRKTDQAVHLRKDLRK